MLGFLVPHSLFPYNFVDMDDFGLDMEEVTKVIESAQVLVVRFAIVDKRLLVDTRTNEKEGPFIGVVPKAGSVEERFKSLKRLRPRFPLPEKIMSFMWPRHMETFRNSGLWNRIVRPSSGATGSRATAASQNTRNISIAPA